ncbi:MAG: methyl-accepting chemotaxis protein [Treponema sp.]|jgi:methyl-accepting chemotaxis protein|nr:methyl-accepting chemotaxis protein [Treponema sp.]
MTTSEIREKINRDEFEGEKLISNVRLLLALIYTVSTTGIAVIRNLQGSGFIPWRSHIMTGIFLLYTIFLFIYVRKKETLNSAFKYICVVLDMTVLSAVIWISCTYLEVSPPLPFLSSRALFYSILILAGSFRYSTPCAYFSGIYAAISFFVVIFVNRNTLDLPYYFVLEGKTINVSFPLYNELFKFFGMIITGWVTGVASKRRLALFNNMIESETAAASAASTTVDQTRNMAKTIHKSTDEIFLSSKDIFSTANNQAASVQEIESTIKQNAQIAVEIAEKTSSVATIASKMENDVINGFSVLERNVDQLENIKSKNDGVISGIIALGNKIIKIRDIVKNINTITDQTKVIAFNAALEAASAGDRGKRFSVVASEVNRLADDIAALTKQIREQVEEIQSSSSSLIIKSEESADKIIEGNSLIKELEDIFREIRSGAEITVNQAQIITISTQKQQKSTEQINIAISDISNGLSKFINSTRVATSSAEELTEMIKELDELLADSARDEKETIKTGYSEERTEESWQ